MERRHFLSLLLGVAGCASLSAPPTAEVQVAGIKEVVGAWEGWVLATGAPTLRVRLSIQPDGLFTWVGEQNPMYSGHLRVIEGALRYGALFPRGWDWAGVVTRAVGVRAEYLSWRRNDGTLIGEFSRAK
jgi:hypothetical protein